MIDFKQVGCKICLLRKEHNLSQEDLASKMYVSRQGLSKWENGTAVPSVDSILELSQFFGISIEELLCLDSKTVVDPTDIFKGQERLYIVNKLIRNELDVNLVEIFNQLLPSERLMVLKAIKDGRLYCPIEKLRPKLTNDEDYYLWRSKL